LTEKFDQVKMSSEIRSSDHSPMNGQLLTVLIVHTGNLTT
jgi:hypothetical protein